jgi:hypothetical protein
VTGPTEDVPALTPEIVEDDEALAEWVDNAIRLDPVAKARAREIADRCEWLRDACEPDIWKLYREVDARVTERWTSVTSALVRYAFEAGMRHPREPGAAER